MAKIEEIRHILEMLANNKITAEQAANLMSALESRDEDVKKETDFDFSSISDVVTQMAEMSKSIGQIGARIGSQLMDELNIPDFSIEPYKVKKLKYVLGDNAGIQVDVSGKINVYQQNEGTNEVLLFIRHTENSTNKLNEVLLVNNSQNNLNVILDKNCKKPVNVDIHIPAIHLNRVVLLGRNGKVFVSQIMAKTLEIATINGRIEGTGIQSDKLNITTSNGRVNLNGCNGETLKVTSANSNVELKDNTFFDEISAVSTNGKIDLFNQEGNRITLNSTNGNLRITDGFCELMMANTTNGSILIRNLRSKFNPRCDVEATSGNGNISIQANKDIGMAFEARTENGQIQLGDQLMTVATSEKIGNRMIKATGHGQMEKKELGFIDLKLKTFIGMIKIDWINGGLYNG